jgi:uncharacterized protein (DUF58 family)
MSHVGRYLDPNLLERLNQLQLSARSVVEGSTAGTHRSRVKGASIDFRQHRFYVPGDEPRRLDWRLLARTDRPYVREYHEETNLRCLLMLDHSGSMSYSRNFGTKFEYAARMVAAMAYLMLGQTESVGLATFSSKLDQWLVPHAHSKQLSRVIETLERTEPTGGPSTETAMHQVADRLGRRSLVILVSDLFMPSERFRQGLARLRHDRHEVIVMQVLDPDELEFPFRGFTRFHGAEGEVPRLADAALIKKQYLANFKKHRAEIEESCRTLGAEFVEFRTDHPLDDAMISYLRRRAGQ